MSVNTIIATTKQSESTYIAALGLHSNSNFENITVPTTISAVSKGVSIAISVQAELRQMNLFELNAATNNNTWAKAKFE